MTNAAIDRRGDEGSNGPFPILNAVLADAFTLYVKTKGFHWHMTGPHFRDYHLMLDEQATQLIAMTDVVAERLRKLGSTTLRSIGDIQRHARISDDDGGASMPAEMLRRLREDNVAFVDTLRAAHEQCGASGDIATTSLLENFVDDTEGRIWFLSETIGREASGRN